MSYLKLSTLWFYKSDLAETIIECLFDNNGYHVSCVSKDALNFDVYRCTFSFQRWNEMLHTFEWLDCGQSLTVK